MNTFEKWQNKEIDDIACIRELRKENEEMKNLFIEIDEYINPNPQNYIGFNSMLHKKIKEVIK